VFYHFIQSIAKNVTNEKYNEIVTIREFFEKLKQRIENHIRMEKMLTELKQKDSDDGL